MKKKWTSIFETTAQYLKEQAKSTCSEPLFALIELITNSDVAYKGLEKKGIRSRGEILIEVYPHNKNSKYVVTDYALGLDEKDIAEKVKKIGGDQSGLTKEIGGRSFFGRGLKEALISFGYGEITSIKNGKLFKAVSRDVELSFEGERAVFEIDKKELGAGFDENCTRITLVAKNEHMQRTPQFENLRDSLIKYFELRDILQDNSRKVMLRYYRQSDIKEEVLTYNPIISEKIEEKPIKLPEFPDADVIIEVYEAENDIPNIQDKFLSERGFLVCSKNAIHAIDYFGFENHPASSKIFGRIKSEFIDFLMREKREMLFDSSRSGNINRKHDFIKSLCRETQKVLAPLYEKISVKIGQADEIQDKETDNNVKKALQYFNKIAKDLLKEIDTEVGPPSTRESRKKKEDLPPPNGFDFTPPYIQATVNYPTTITLKLAKEFGHLRKKLIIDLENKNIEILRERGGWEFNKKGFWVFRTVILGKNVGDSSIVKARIEKLPEARLIIEVKEKSKGGGLFNDWAIDKNYPPEQRVQYIRGTGKIIIAANSPSVKPFVNINSKLHSVETRLLIAELILTSCCNEIARQMILRGKEPLISTDPDGIAEQVQNLLTRLTNKHARASQLMVIRGKLEEHIKV